MSRKGKTNGVDLDKALRLAQFECEQDPYRGIALLDGPFLRKENCKCHNGLNNSGKKRKRPGTAASAPKETACDYNPFCLFSLGGIFEKLASNGTQEVIDLEKGDGDNDDDDVVEVIEDKKPKINKRLNTGDDCDASTLFLEPVEFSSEELNPYKKDTCIYSEGTIEQLKAVRKLREMDISPIGSYLGRLLGVESDLEVSLQLDNLQKQHNALLLPIYRLKPASNDVFHFAMPVGMMNLGATCYLNTQLQCLARNQTFLKGIFAWKASSTNRMNHILENLQMLLKRLVYGSESTVTTEEFAKSLGLESDEQQDPNEFGRLLLERMHEAFSGTSNASLLPQLFQGTMAYETACRTCRKKTLREEHFMDLNLPIVHEPPKEEPKKCGQLKISDTFSAKLKAKKSDRSTNVQYCLDQYTFPEELVGDNQYFCETCGSKQDATRSLRLLDLPPILNLQMCRYVFDMRTFAKKKLSDPVLLPLELEVSSRTYRLCAVMKHLGTSAYRGHYVAEAMDWATGKWFEFNDELVKELKEGPSCSYNPAAKTTKKGSTDAYNLYYISEDYLAQCVRASLTPSGEDSLRNEREERYQMVTEMCGRDERVADRLLRRRRALMEVFRDADRELDLSQDHYWLDNALLREIFESKATSETPRVDFFAEGSAVSLRQFRCPHNAGLHPRTARTGKLLSKELYQGLAALMGTERNFLRRSSGASFIDNEISINDGLLCGECSTEYSRELQEKLNFVRKLESLHRGLDPKVEGASIGLAYAPDDQDPDIYAVHKKFVTTVRSRLAALFKELESDNCPQGLDGLDISNILSNTPTTKENDMIDMAINSSIVCRYGKCCKTTNSRSIRWVQEKTWNALVEFFPEATTLKKKRSQLPVLVRCRQCEGTNEERNVFREWATTTNELLPPKVLQGKRKHHTVLCPPDQNEESLCAIRKSDGIRLYGAVETCRATQQDVEVLKEELRMTLFSGGDGSGFVSSWNPESLICKCHEHCLAPLLFCRRPHRTDEERGPIWEFSNEVILLHKSEHLGFVKAVKRLFELLFGETEEILEKDLLPRLEGGYHPRLVPLNRGFNFFYGDEDTEYERFYCALGSDSLEIALYPIRCADEGCNKACIDLLPSPILRERESRAKPIQSVLNVDNEVEIIDQPPPKPPGSITIRLFEIEEDAKLEAVALKICESRREPSSLDARFLRRSSRKPRKKINVSEVRDETKLTLQKGRNIAALRLHILEKCQDFLPDLPLTLFVPNMSGTKGGGKAEDKVGQSDNKDEHFVSVDLGFDLNARSIDDVLAMAMDPWNLSKEDMQKHLDEVFILRREHLFPTKREARGEQEQNREATMDALLQVANIHDQNGGPASVSKSRAAATQIPERGFTGTFLQSSAPVRSSPKQEPAERKRNKDEVNEKEEEEEKKEEEEKQAETERESTASPSSIVVLQPEPAHETKLNGSADHLETQPARPIARKKQQQEIEEIEEVEEIEVIVQPPRKRRQRVKIERINLVQETTEGISEGDDDDMRVHVASPGRSKRPKRAYGSREKVRTVMLRLKENVESMNVEFNEAMCREAATQAVQSNPRETPAVLLNAAINIYLVETE